ncbi:MAG: restriction endonuclease subunit S [Fibrobacteraceae bacterium]|nr:restriction endonuclease subunit S [Fibrobacteraceae bacterium]
MMKRLGDYIRPVDVRNRDLKVTRLVGLTIDKAFIPSVANTIGTDLSNYKVISENQFACSLMQVSRDGKMPIAMFKGEPCIMSPAYPMFEVSKTNELLPEYLMMWFSRSEFDREASFYAVGGVRGSLEWNDFCDMRIPVPAIEKQREIVAEYNTLATRIETNKKLIATLEQTAQTLYRHTFVDNIDPNNLPEGWRMGTLGDLYQFQYGKGNNNPDNGGVYPVYGSNGIIGGFDEYNAENSPVIGHIGVCGSLVFAFGKHFVTYNGVICQIRNPEWTFWGYVVLQNCNLKQQVRGSSQPFISYDMLYEIPVIIPSNFEIEKMNEYFKSVLENAHLKQQENQTLTQMQTLLLSKMGRDKEVV